MPSRFASRGSVWTIAILNNVLGHPGCAAGFRRGPGVVSRILTCLGTRTRGGGASGGDGGHEEVRLLRELREGISVLRCIRQGSAEALVLWEEVANYVLLKAEENGRPRLGGSGLKQKETMKDRFSSMVWAG